MSARQLTIDVDVEMRTAADVIPRPDVLPFLATPASAVVYERKRRDSAALQRYSEGYIIIADAPVLQRVGRSGRAKLAERRASIGDNEQERMRTLSGQGWSLRRIARDLGVSHETVRRELADAMVEV